MGKYKQWLHHQEVGRRLRDQIATLEQERERVQKMAPTHPTTLPDLDNPIIGALIAYTRQGNVLNRGGDPRAAFGQHRMDTDPEPRRPALGGSTLASGQAGASAAPAGRDAAAVGNTPARATQPGGAAEADTAPTPSPAPKGAGQQNTDSVGGWWQRYRPNNDQG
jgi:hypothetical protein